ncbi:MAG TPA: protein phosphatase [Paracoccaceae bacterium]|nr:protein phosphatase [Paracoccaceae bacterium]
MHRIEVGGGTLALAPLPVGDAALAAVLGWRPDVVLSLTDVAERAALGAGDLPVQVMRAGIGWIALPVADYGVPPDWAMWAAVSARLRGVLAAGGRVLIHCRGGCGRSGMAALRLMVETGEVPEAALARLRAVRPCAVETAAQQDWAMRAAGPDLSGS